MHLARRPRTSGAEAFERACRIVGRRAPIRTVVARRRRPDQVDLFIHTAIVNGAILPAGLPAPIPMVGCGAARNAKGSIVAAVGEAIERLCGSTPMLRGEMHATRRELGDDAIDPGALAPFSEEQRSEPRFPFPRFDDDEPIAWVRAFSLSLRKPLWVPAEAIYLGAHCRHVHLVGTSSGLAAGPTLEEALAAAICELVERDAFMITWAARRTPPEIDLDSCTHPAVGDLRRRAGEGRVELRAFDVTTDVGVPTVLAAAIGVGGQAPSLAVGAASRLSARAALGKALLEALHTWNWTFELIAARGELPGPDAEADLAIRDFADLVHLYAHPWRRRALDFLLEPRDKVPLRDETAPAETPAEEVERLVSAIGRTGCQVLAIDLSPDPEWDAGVRVVRALSPDLVPLSLCGQRFYRGCERYFEVPKRLGDPSPPEADRDLNREPHPFP